MNLTEHRQFFNNTFHKKLGITLNDVLDNFMTMCFAKPTLDILKFDKILREKYGDFEDQGLSFNDVIKNNFGADAVKKLEELFI